MACLPLYCAYPKCWFSVSSACLVLTLNLYFIFFLWPCTCTWNIAAFISIPQKYISKTVNSQLHVNKKTGENALKFKKKFDPAVQSRIKQLINIYCFLLRRSLHVVPYERGRVFLACAHSMRTQHVSVNPMYVNTCVHLRHLRDSTRKQWAYYVPYGIGLHSWALSPPKSISPITIKLRKNTKIVINCNF